MRRRADNRLSEPNCHTRYGEVFYNRFCECGRYCVWDSSTSGHPAAVLLRQNRSLRKLSQQGSPAGGMAVSQLSPSHGEVEEGKGRGQTVYNYSPLNEMSDGRTPIESGGRSVVQELPARYTGR
jgi:hypothetical protein